MRRSVMLILALVAGTFGTGVALAADRVVQATPRDGQSSQYVQGRRIVAADVTPDLTVAVTASPNNKRTAWITVFVENRTEQPIDLIPTAIQARSDDRIVKVYSPEEVIKKEKRRQAWEAFGAGLAMAGNAYNASQAGHYNTYGNYSGTYSGYGTGGSSAGNYQGTYSGSGYDPYAAALARQQAANQNAQIATALKSDQSHRMASIDDRLLRAQTLMPGQSFVGDVLIDLPRRNRRVPVQEIELTISIGNSAVSFGIRVEG